MRCPTCSEPLHPVSGWQRLAIAVHDLEQAMTQFHAEEINVFDGIDQIHIARAHIVDAARTLVQECEKQTT